MRRFDRLAEAVGRVMGALVALPPVLAVVFSALLVGSVCAVNCVLLLPLAALRR